tara:strand:+ start:1172 stop:1291 length:120 start_codon:yes stop_codon:yes gene_type:complete
MPIYVLVKFLFKQIVKEIVLRQNIEIVDEKIALLNGLPK